MSQSLRMTASLKQSLRQDLTLRVFMPEEEWSLVKALKAAGPNIPPYREPALESEEFEPRIHLQVAQLPGYEQMTHVERMEAIDEANATFRFAYTRGTWEESGKPAFFFKIPLLRNRHVDPEDIKIRITSKEYYDATALLESAGPVQRIVRAIPYSALLHKVSAHLRARYQVGLHEVVCVSVDRGGRIPCLVLMHALGHTAMETLKVDQGGAGVDVPKLAKLAAAGTLQGKHTLFVDSTVDSGRQLRMLVRYLEEQGWADKLGMRSWSLVGSNDEARSVDPRHQDINWGVDPDSTFEDRPQLMGIDYGDSNTQVRECPTEESEAIRECILAVPQGEVILAQDFEAEIERQRRLWEQKRREREERYRLDVLQARAAYKVEVAKAKADHREALKQARVEDAKNRQRRREERRLQREQDKLERKAQRQQQRAQQAKQVAPQPPVAPPAVSQSQPVQQPNPAQTPDQVYAQVLGSQQWLALKAKQSVMPPEQLPASVPNGHDHVLHNVLVVGNGQQQDLSAQAAQFVADNLGPHCSFFAGTPDGNPGAVLRALLNNPKVPQPEARLYQPDYMQTQNHMPMFGGVPVQFAGPGKEGMRWRMISDAHVTLVLGGREGTLREAIFSLMQGKPTLLIKGYGPVANLLCQPQFEQRFPHLVACNGLADAVGKILAMG